jgi:hypothetical protein
MASCDNYPDGDWDFDALTFDDDDAAPSSSSAGGSHAAPALVSETGSESATTAPIDIPGTDQTDSTPAGYVEPGSPPAHETSYLP